MDWSDPSEDRPWAVLAVGGSLTIVLVGGVVLVGWLAFGPGLGCHPVGYAPQVAFSYAESTAGDGTAVTVSVESTPDDVRAARLFVTGEGLNRSWAALDGRADESVLIDPGDEITLEDLSPGDTFRVVWVPGPGQAFDPDSGPRDCGDGGTRAALGSHTVVGNQSDRV